MGIMGYEGGWNKLGIGCVLRNKGWSLEIGREKKEQPVSLGQVLLTPLASPCMGSKGCGVPRIMGLGCGDWVAVAPHLGEMDDPLF